MQRELFTSNRHIFFSTILYINFSILDQPLVLLEHSTLQKCYLCENQIKGKEKVCNITVPVIYTIKICTEKWKTHKEASYKDFHLVWDKVKNISCESLKNNKLICHSQCRHDFTNDAKISRYNQLEIAFGDNVFSGTAAGSIRAYGLNCFCRMVDRRVALSITGSLSEILTITTL